MEESGSISLGQLEAEEKEEEEARIQDVAASLKKRIAENNGEFSETIPVDARGKLEQIDEDLEGTGNPRSLLVHEAYITEEGGGGPESLYGVAKKVKVTIP